MALDPLAKDVLPKARAVVVVGAGIIGVACALRLAEQGKRVCVLDPQPPGQGASFGNAGHLATEQVFPIADWSIVKRLPAMLLDPMGPLRLDWRYLPSALPWFARLLLNLRPAPLNRTVAGLRALNEASLGAWQRLLRTAGISGALKEEGSLLAFERPASRPALNELARRMRAQGVAVDLWQADTLRAAAPSLSHRLQGGLFFPQTGHFVDPYQVLLGLVAAAKAAGVRFERARVNQAWLTPQGVTLATDHGRIGCSQVLIACGAHSAALTHALTGQRVPLDTERGYHLMLPREMNRLPFAVTSLERRFIMTPLAGGLRLAGTVEFAGLERPPNMGRAWQLHALSHGLFQHPLNADEATPWMGFRPSLPDSLPVIDCVADGRVLLAFGHQHLGLTQAAITAEWIAGLANADQAEKLNRGLHLSAYRLARFK